MHGPFFPAVCVFPVEIARSFGKCNAIVKMRDVYMKIVTVVKKFCEALSKEFER